MGTLAIASGLMGKLDDRAVPPGLSAGLGTLGTSGKRIPDAIGPCMLGVAKRVLSEEATGSIGVARLGAGLAGAGDEAGAGGDRAGDGAGDRA